jgi:hypothetical protein
LQNYELDDETKRQHYEHTNLFKLCNLTPVQEQYHWYPVAPKNVEAQIIEKQTCDVKFTTTIKDSQDCNSICFDKDIIQRFNQTFDNKQYVNHLDMTDDIKFQYTWWLYCLNSQERTYITQQVVNHNKVCELHITVES